MLPNLICPWDDNSTLPVGLMMHVVIVFKDPSRLNLTNDNYHAEVVDDI
jgi:hypothetical protein